MPELPDVEHLSRYVARHALGQPVRRVVVTDAAILRNTTPRDIDRALRGHTFEPPARHGKWLIAWTTGPAVLLHFGMTGDLLWADGPRGRHRHDRVVFVLDGGELRYRNMRKLGGVWLAHDAGRVAALIGTLGPDALALTRDEFLAVLARRRGRIKAVLMNQQVLAGIGNLLADEILWQARIHPERRLEDLPDEARRQLHRHLRRVLRTWVERFGDLPRGWLAQDRGTDGACPRCGGPLARTVVGGRTTFFCPRCQPP